MGETRSPGLPRSRTFQSEPGLVVPPKPAAEFFHSRSLSELALGKAPESAQLPRAVETASAFPEPRRALLPREALAFFLALVFPLLSAPVCLFLWFCARFLFRAISSLPISVWVWACDDAVLISVNRCVRESRAASALVFSQPPLAFPILRRLALLAEWPWALFLASQTVDASSLICPSLFWLRGSEIFLVSERTRHASRLARIERGGFLVPH